LAAAPKEPDGQHTERECPAGEDHRLTTGEPFDLGEELAGVALTHVAADSLDLLSATIGVLGQRRLGAFLAQMLTGLAKRLCHTGHRFDEILLAHVEPGRHLIRDCLSGLIGHRARLPVTRTALGRTATLARAGNSTGGLLDLVDDLAAEMVRSVSYRRFGIGRSAFW